MSCKPISGQDKKKKPREGICAVAVAGGEKKADSVLKIYPKAKKEIHHIVKSKD